ncbi:MAG: TetR/AcrR family transcriptional regulator [Halieaceae bacterium]|nr:TetR/AcrR family transcriptional regulator [Halieaceae bacterium]
MARTASNPRGDRTREKILDAAELVFARQNFSAARLEDVAQKVGIRRASIVYYFKSKQELYDEVESRVYSELEEKARQASAAHDTTEEKLIALAYVSLEVMVKRPLLPRLILRRIADLYPGRIPPRRYSGDLVQLWRDILEKGEASGEIKPISSSHLMQIVAMGIVSYATGGELLLSDEGSDTETYNLDQFKRSIRKTIVALLNSD